MHGAPSAVRERPGQRCRCHLDHGNGARGADVDLAKPSQLRHVQQQRDDDEAATDPQQSAEGATYQAEQEQEGDQVQKTGSDQRAGETHDTTWVLVAGR